MTTLNPYLQFRGNAREAIEFYHGVFGGDLSIDTFGQWEGMVQDPAEADLVMHSQLRTPEGLVLMASDTPSSMPYREPAGIAVSVSGGDETQLQAYWDGLADGGIVTMPFDTPPWGGRFGMLTDRFGIDWMLSWGPDEE
ncbi:VOC family protein [Microbacterium sp. ET2]|uniref:VOC family protein n=1 Tax=Microbacterium albipurpureum TaxID=3050384 RepID=UPI00259CFDB0|nr:VOC family protein [Microbacterium sp. ET2 (Ac-2212)]WJL96508.1 VOC family protein [Microbacterium sp. ET2 (Ac-2212)]